MQKPSAVVFDLGKVLLDFDYSIVGRRMAERSHLPPKEIERLLDHSPLLIRFEMGLLTSEQFFGEVCSLTKFGGTHRQFCDYFGDIFSEMPEMIDLHAQLRARGVPTYIFSNTNDIAIGHVRKRFPFFNNFDGYVFSFQVGAMKPHARIYEAMEAMTGRRGPEILYIDDRTENVAPGAARGWQTILQETPEKTITAVKKTGLL